jgi:FkbM family methyltransferase
MKLFEPKSGSPPSWRDRLLLHYRRRGWRGFLRLYNFLKPAVARREIRTISKYGSEFFIEHQDAVDAHVINEGFYESEVLEAVRPSLGTDAVLWVIGANFGLHAVTAKFLHPATTVIAFEPSPAMAARLLENSALNAVKIALHAYALGEQRGALPFYANASGNPGMSTLHPVANFTYDQTFVVAILTAAEVLERGLAPAPTAIILDAEGAETAVLRGFGGHLAGPALRRIVFEAANDFLFTHEPADLYTLITEAGFSVSILTRQERTSHRLSNFVAIRG